MVFSVGSYLAMSGGLDSHRKAYELEKICTFRKATYLQTAFMAGSISGVQLQEHFQSYWQYEILMLAALRYGEEGKLAKAGKVLTCALQLCVRDSASMRYVANSKDGIILSNMRKKGAEHCLGQLSEIISTPDTNRRNVLLNRLAQIYPGLSGVWQPELIFSAFEAGNAADVNAWPKIWACRGVIPM